MADIIQNDEIPVFLINGFLDAGKTSFIAYTISEEYFHINGNTLLIVGEEGETGYDERLLKMCQEIENKTAIDEEGNPCLYLPSILYIREGMLIDIHVGTVSGHDASVMGLSEKQRARLVYNLEKEIDALLGAEK